MIIPNQKKSYLFALLAVIFWSTIAVAFKLSLGLLNPFQILFIASLVSFVFFFVITTIYGNRRGSGFPKVSMKDVKSSALLGFLNPFLYYIVLLHAYDMITAQEAMTLNYIWPVMLALLSVPLLGQRMGLLSLLAMLISFAGIIIIATKGNFATFRITDYWGGILAAGSSVIWALYWIFNMKDNRPTKEKLMLNFFFGTLYATITLLIFSKPVLPTLHGWLAGTYVGLFEMGITFFVWLTALKLSRKTYLVSQFIFLSPFLSLIWIRLILKEPVLTSTVVGLALILAGILIQQRQERVGSK